MKAFAYSGFGMVVLCCKDVSIRCIGLVCVDYTYSVPLIHRVTGSLALVLPGLDDSQSSAGDTEHLFAMLISTVGTPELAGITYGDHDGIGNQGLERDRHDGDDAAAAGLGLRCVYCRG